MRIYRKEGKKALNMKKKLISLSLRKIRKKYKKSVDIKASFESDEAPNKIFLRLFTAKDIHAIHQPISGKKKKNGIST